MLGLDWQVRFETALAAHDLPENDRREDYLRARLSLNAAGQPVVDAFGKQDSSMLRLLSDADALIVRAPLTPALKEEGFAVERPDPCRL